MLSQSATINDFPDEILCHVLSFLPIKEAFRTSILSKRWLPLCYSLSDLYYNHSLKIHLRQFMDAVMLSPHSQHQKLKSLTLDFNLCSYKYLDDTAANCVDTWFEAAKRRNLEKLHISFLDIHIPLAPTIFCCKTLVKLSLIEIKVATMFHCSVDLPLLKSFYLADIVFEHMVDFKKLLSGCPNLLYLTTRYIKATTGGVTTGEYFKPLSKLYSAYIDLFEVPLRAVPNVKFLSLIKRQMGKNLPNEEINSYYKGCPVFKHLIELELLWFDHNGILDLDYEVMRMLQNCPKLQRLLISKFAKGKEVWKYPDHVPECVSSHLTTCTIIEFEPVEAHIRFATYILQNAKLLRVMEIGYMKSPDLMESPQYLEYLSSCPRISPVCKLSAYVLK